MFRNKKGISPLIATVLIIGFTVALAAIIMTWGTTFSRGMQQQSEEQANLKMICTRDVVFSVKSACVFDANTVKITVQNDGNIALLNLTARLFQTPTSIEAVQGIEDASGNRGLDAFGIRVFEVPWTGGAATVKQVEAVPIIDVAERQVTCAETIAKFGDVLSTKNLDSCA